MNRIGVNRMPFFDYKCSKCGKTFEFLQQMNEEPKKECPDCKSETLEKQLSAPSFRINGSSYKNGYSTK